MKKIVSLVLCLVIALGLFTVTAPAADETKVILNGEQLEFDVSPIIINGRTLVPFRAILEALGAEVMWESSFRLVTATNGNIVIKLQIDNVLATVNGVEVVLDVPARIMNDRTLVPLRFISENLGFDVGWDGDSHVITIIGSIKPTAAPTAMPTLFLPTLAPSQSTSAPLPTANPGSVYQPTKAPSPTFSPIPGNTATPTPTSTPNDHRTMSVQFAHLTVNNLWAENFAIVSPESRTFVGIGEVVEKLGMTYLFNTATKTVYIDGDIGNSNNASATPNPIDLPHQQTIDVWHDCVNEFIVNGVISQVVLDAPGFMYNGEVYVPIRAVVELLDVEASWDSDTMTVHIDPPGTH